MLEQRSLGLYRPFGARESLRSFTPGLRPGLLSGGASRLIEAPTLVEPALAEYYEARYGFLDSTKDSN